MNTAINYLTGRVGQDLELRHTRNQVPFTQLSLAEKRGFRKGDKWEVNAVWHRFTVWADLAENAARLLRKGSLIQVCFRIDNEHTSVKDHDGVIRERDVPSLVMTGFEALADYGKEQE